MPDAASFAGDPPARRREADPVFFSLETPTALAHTGSPPVTADEKS